MKLARIAAGIVMMMAGISSWFPFAIKAWEVKDDPYGAGMDVPGLPGFRINRGKQPLWTLCHGRTIAYDLVALELHLMQRAAGMLLESPAVRP